MRVGIVGAGGYAGQELLRWLSAHPFAEPSVLVARGDSAFPPAAWPPALARLAASLPVLHGFDADAVAARCDVAMLALPGGASAPVALALRERGVTVVDLGGDLRLKDHEAYVKWYGGSSPLPRSDYEALVREAVYGLPEWSRRRLPGAGLVTLPGCYPTAALLLLVPLLAEGWVSADNLVLSAASGITGAGNSPGPSGLFAQLAENFHPYKTGRHQHRPEIEQALHDLAGVRARLAWTTHLAPMRRGLLVTATLWPTARDPRQAPAALARAYADAPLVDVQDGEVQTAWVRETARAALALSFDPHAGALVGFAAIDNLGKGAATQAVQALNLVAGWPETSGLEAVMSTC